MPDTPTGQSSRKDIPARDPETDSPPPPAGRKRWIRKTILTPIMLAIIGLALLMMAFFLYPNVTQLPTPPYPILVISSPFFPISYVNYIVKQKSTYTAEIVISVDSIAPQARTKAAGLSLGLPIKTQFRDCPPSVCIISAGHFYTVVWPKRLIFRRSSLGWTATAGFLVNAPSFDETFNGISASAAIPDVEYQGSGTPTLQAAYYIKSASSYDWSSFPSLPVRVVTSSFANWQEPLIQGDTASRAVVGTDHAAQSEDDFRIFLAGALIALAGGAILAAFLEALHAPEWAALGAQADGLSELPHPPRASWRRQSARSARDWHDLFSGPDPG